jgi:hypothetical protein
VPKQARQPVGRVQRRRTCDERMHIAPALPLPRGADWPDYRVYRHVACSVSLHYLRNGSDDTAARATPRCAILAVSPALFSFSVVKDCARNYCSGPYWAGAICRLEATMQVKQTAVSPRDNLSSPLHAYLKRPSTPTGGLLSASSRLFLPYVAHERSESYPASTTPSAACERLGVHATPRQLTRTQNTAKLT